MKGEWGNLMSTRRTSSYIMRVHESIKVHAMPGGQLYRGSQGWWRNLSREISRIQSNLTVVVLNAISESTSAFCKAEIVHKYMQLIAIYIVYIGSLCFDFSIVQCSIQWSRAQYILKIEKNYTFIPTSLFRDCSLFRGFNDKNIHNHRYKQ